MNPNQITNQTPTGPEPKQEPPSRLILTVASGGQTLKRGAVILPRPMAKTMAQILESMDCGLGVDLIESSTSETEGLLDLEIDTGRASANLTGATAQECLETLESLMGQDNMIWLKPAVEAASASAKGGSLDSSFPVPPEGLPYRGPYAAIRLRRHTANIISAECS